MSIKDFCETFKNSIIKDNEVKNFSATIDQREKDNGLDHFDGGFEFKGKKFTFMGFEGDRAASITVSYSVTIKTKSMKLIDIYKKANKVNSSLPGIKLILDKVVGEVIYITCNIELVQLNPIRDFHFIISMLEILSTAHKYFQDELDGE